MHFWNAVVVDMATDFFFLRIPGRAVDGCVCMCVCVNVLSFDMSIDNFNRQCRLLKIVGLFGKRAL